MDDVIQGLLFLMFNPNLEDPLSTYFDPSEGESDYEEKVRAAMRGEDLEDVALDFECVLVNPVEDEISMSVKVAADECNVPRRTSTDECHDEIKSACKELTAMENSEHRQEVKVEGEETQGDETENEEEQDPKTDNKQEEEAENGKEKKEVRMKPVVSLEHFKSNHEEIIIRAQDLMETFTEDSEEENRTEDKQDEVYQDEAIADAPDSGASVANTDNDAQTICISRQTSKAEAFVEYCDSPKLGVKTALCHAKNWIFFDPALDKPMVYLFTWAVNKCGLLFSNR